jgi:hypothetical protein
MPETRRKFDAEFREGAVRIVQETGKSVAQVARDLGINVGTLGNWVASDRVLHEGSEGLPANDGPSSSGYERRTPSCGWSAMFKPIGGPVGERGDELSVAPSSPTRGPSTRCHTRSAAGSWASPCPGCAKTAGPQPNPPYGQSPQPGSCRCTVRLDSRRSLVGRRLAGSDAHCVQEGHTALGAGTELVLAGGGGSTNGIDDGKNSEPWATKG